MPNYNFHPGQKLRCVSTIDARLEVGKVYTVKVKIGSLVYLRDCAPSGGWFLTRFKPLNDLTPRVTAHDTAQAEET